MEDNSIWKERLGLLVDQKTAESAQRERFSGEFELGLYEV